MGCDSLGGFLLSIAMTPSWEALALSLCLLVLVLPKSSPADSGNGGRHNRRAASSAAGKRKTIHLAGIFPINGIEGWQGGQVRKQSLKTGEFSRD